MKYVLIALLVMIGVVLLGGGCVYQGYREAITLDQDVKGQWAQVENQLQRRYDLIPNLVETAKGYGLQEQKVFLGIADARKAYVGASSVNDKVAAAGQVEGALSRLLVVMENYPQLKSSELFLKLQDSLEGTENRLSVERGKFNDTVKALNAFVIPFPGSFYGSLAGVRPAEYFKVKNPEAEEAPKVNFTGDAKPTTSPAAEQPEKAGQSP